MTLATAHRRAAERLAWSGTAVTFTTRAAGTIDPATNLYSGASTSTVTGKAIALRGDPETYTRLSLTETDAITLRFTPDTPGTLPALGDAVTWDGVAYTVRSVEPIAPNGTPRRAVVVASR